MDNGKWSLPTRERGLKWAMYRDRLENVQVAPHTGAWIEMIFVSVFPTLAAVAPHTGAWIEDRKSTRLNSSH